PHRHQLPGLRGQAGTGMTSASFPAAVLFDLDGTLLDSAPDFVATANRMRQARQLPPVDPEQLRAVVSKGSRAMLEVAFPQMAESERHALIPEFLDIYESLIGQHARLFDGIETMLAALEQAGVPCPADPAAAGLGATLRGADRRRHAGRAQTASVAVAGSGTADRYGGGQLCLCRR